MDLDLCLEIFERMQLLRFIFEDPTAYLHEIQRKFVHAFGVSISASSICRTLKSMGCSRQVVRHIAMKQSDYRAKFMSEICLYNPGMFIWLDESGCDRRNSIRKYGYSIRGIRPIIRQLLVRGIRYSAIPIMTAYGLHDVYLAEGSINGERFTQFLQKYLVPSLMPFNGVNPFSIVIMDNASIHHVDSALRVIQSVGAKVIFLPPYSPDLNPLEPVFGKVKSLLKENDAAFQTSSSPKTLLTMVFGMITQEDCVSYTRHCDYM